MTTTNEAHEIARGWVQTLGDRLVSADALKLGDLIRPDGWWRDLLTFTWDVRSFVGVDAVQGVLTETVGRARPYGFRLSPGSPVDHIGGGVEQIGAWFDFETAVGPARGFVRLLGDDDGARRWRALAVVTQLEQIRDAEERTGSRRPRGTVHGGVSGRPTWSAQRAVAQEFSNEDPVVVVIGGGQSGLTVAARLEQLDLPTLVIERNERVGDNWRRRYPSLTLHDPVGMDHLPYLPFPSTWPTFTPKDKFADWLEFYAAAMELNVWTSAEIEKLAFDDPEQRWTLQVQRGDGTERVLRPRHVVIATGLNGAPSIPDLKGREDFRGTVVHSSAFDGGEHWGGRRAIVVGAGVSGHDVAQNLCEHGADVTLVQRSSTYVVRSETWYSVFLPFYLEGGPSTEDADLMASSVPFGVAPALMVEPTRIAAELDRELLGGLEAVGFALDYGPDGQGLMAKHLSGLEGYYIDVGASGLIAEGRITVHQGAGAEGFEADALVLTDGSRLPADLVVLATGYEGVLSSSRDLLGDLADNVQPVYGIAPDGEMSGVWRHSGQDGLWFMVGQLQATRIYSKILALRIKAIELGLTELSVGYRGEQAPMAN